jgi:hypothetical protein
MIDFNDLFKKKVWFVKNITNDYLMWVDLNFIENIFS